MDDNERANLQEIVDAALMDMKRDGGDEFDLSSINLAEFQRKTGLSRARARTLKDNGFKVVAHKRCGQKAEITVLSGFTGVIDNLLRQGVTNSEVCYERIAELGYRGGLTSVKNYIKEHADLVPAKRKTVEVQGIRANRFRTNPGEAYQMDWGFVSVKDWEGRTYKIACFAMVCHHCGTCYIEFFPNARQENLFIGMVHAFMLMGVPECVLTDNMKSVAVKRDFEGNPIWQTDYAAFMACVGFKTKLCKPRHPFTKGKVERLVRFVKDNFLAGRSFLNVTQLNSEALTWCAAQNSKYRRALDCIPSKKHEGSCSSATSGIERTDDVVAYLCPIRKISFDGFVSYESRRFGVPCWYTRKTCRVNRDGSVLHIYSTDLSVELAVHAITWSRADSYCADQYGDAQPCELPTAPVKTTIAQIEPPKASGAFAKFDFEGML